MVVFMLRTEPMEAAIEAASRRTEESVEESPSSSTEVEQPRLEGVPAGTLKQIDRVTALLDVASSYLDSVLGQPSDDHTLVVVHVAAEQLAESVTDHIDQKALASGSEGLDADLEPGTLRAGTAYVEGQGAIEAATAQRLVCTATLLGAVVDASGDVLALGRSSRLATRAQRRALKVRDRGVCQFPGCLTRHHLDAHHLTPWSQGGRTDLANLLLLCRRHHTFVHEGGVRIGHEQRSGSRFSFIHPDGQPVTATWAGHPYGDQIELWKLARLAKEQRAAIQHQRHELLNPTRLRQVGAGRHDHTTRIFPRHGGYRFSLNDCVRTLFERQSPQVVPAA